MKTASKLSSNVMKYYFIDEMSTIIDEERSVTHEKLSEETEGILDDPKLFKKLRLPDGVRTSTMVVCIHVY